MKVMHNRRGVTLIEAMVTMFILSMAMLVFAACMPTAHKASRQAQEYKIATAIAQEKMEQLRSLSSRQDGYTLLTPTLLYTNGIIDSSEAAYYNYFTTRDQVASKLAQGSGRIRITDYTSDMKKVRVYVNWVSSSHSIPRSIRLTSYIVDKRARKTN